VVDAGTVARAQAGDAEAFATLYAVYAPRITQYCQRLLGDPEEAAEAGQDVFLKAFAAIGRTAGHPLQLQGWLYRIAANRCLDALRRRQVIQWVALDPGAPAQQRQLVGDSNPEHAALRSELRAEVRAVLARLPEDYRLALQLREFGELTYQEIAQALGTSSTIVKNRLCRARGAFRRLWDAGGARGMSSPSAATRPDSSCMP
jgi:RNA polymerase sigma-70 factor (ECF subfamily)